MPSRADPRSLEMIRRLVAFDTTSRDSNLSFIDFVRDYLDGFGIASRLTFDDERRKANLYATIGPADRGGILLSGHTDVVPVDGQDWSTDPFSVVERDGRLYGRGTADMKSFIAIALALVPEMVERNLALPVHLALSYDEEVGCIGVPRLIEDLATLSVRPRACVVGEPTEMKVVTGHKGRKGVRCRVHGLACHSALAPQGVNAVEYAAETIARLRRMARRAREEGPFDHNFDPPYTTIQANVVRGGTAPNIVARDCEFEFEIRNVPQDDPEALFREITDFVETELVPEMRRVHPSAGFEWNTRPAVAGLDTGEDEEVTVLVKSLTGANTVGTISFGTEAGLFQRSGIPTVICGPGNIEQAHKPDEFIELSQIAQCEAFMRRLIDHLARA